MAFIDPKINWDEAYEPAPEDMNRIEGNISVLKTDTEELENDKADKTTTNALETNKADKTTNLTAGDGLNGGGTLATDRNFAVDTSVVRTSRTLTAGDGLSGGGTLAGNRTFNVDGTVARVYTGSAQNETNYPIGTIVSVFTQSREYDLNSTTALYITTTSAGKSVAFDYDPGSSGTLSGTWRARGYVGYSTSSSFKFHIFQRVS